MARQNVLRTDGEIVLVIFTVFAPKGVFVLTEVHAIRLLDD
jgi:hypothetical protein